MKKVTIRHTLFVGFFIIILICFLSIAAIFCFFEVPRQKEQTISVLKQNCSIVTESADKEMAQIRAVALNIAHSSLIQDKLLNENTFLRGSMTTEETAELQFMLSAMIAPNDHSDVVRLYLPTNEIIEIGRVNGVRAGAAMDQRWYDQIIDKPYHNLFMYMGEDDAMGKYSTGFYGKRFISYVMEQYDSLNISKGYIEVKRSMEAILSSAIRYNSVYGEEIYILDGDGNPIFPAGAALPEYLAVPRAGERTETADLQIAGGRYVFYSPSECSDFCTVLLISTRDLMSPVFDYIGKIAYIAVFTLAAAVVIGLLISKRVSRPIQEMCDEVTAFDLTKPLSIRGIQTDIAELGILDAAFLDMREKLIDSMNKQMFLKNQEMQSRMLALQAQMNPHFLYNSLATIQAMADENMNDEIVEMCLSMSDILRYTASDTEREVPLREEIRHVTDYLRCMAIRHQGDLTFTIQIPEQAKDVKVPKLCIQLLVENAIKFSAANRPPYHIAITAARDEFHHEISVQDNGPGFRPEVLDTLKEKMTEIDNTGLLPSLEINGMGLLNVYIRYKLLHKGKSIFRLENCMPHGALVTIGEYYG